MISEAIGNLVRWAVLSFTFGPGFTFERCGHIEGWLSRDPYNDDWILWSPKTRQMYRSKSGSYGVWFPSPESKQDCIHLGRVYAEMRDPYVTI